MSSPPEEATGRSRNGERPALEPQISRRSVLDACRGAQLVELLWLPFRELKTELAPNGRSGSEAENAEAPTLACLACEITATVSRMNRIGLRWTAPRSPSFPPLIETRELIAKAGEQIERIAFVEGTWRGQSRAPHRDPRHREIVYPVWAVYRAVRRPPLFRRRVRLRVLDAVSGQRAGAALKRAVLLGLAAVDAPPVLSPTSAGSSAEARRRDRPSGSFEAR